MFTRAFKFCLAPVSSKQTLFDRILYTAATTRFPRMAPASRPRQPHGSRAWLQPNCHAPKMDGSSGIRPNVRSQLGEIPRPSD